MPDYLQGLFTGGFIGAAGKWLLDLVAKRNQELVSGRRKMLIGDIDGLAKLVDPLTKSALAYYSKPSAEGAELARQIAIDVQVFARQWAAVNKRLPEVGQKPLPNPILVKFRQAFTMGLLDASRTTALPLDHTTILDLFACLDELHETFSSARFRLN